MPESKEANTARLRKWRANNRQHYRDYQRVYRKAYRERKKLDEEQKANGKHT